jgi:hypothetical protein
MECGERRQQQGDEESECVFHGVKDIFHLDSTSTSFTAPCR